MSVRRTLGRLAFCLISIGAIWLGIRVLLPWQMEDRHHRELKDDYLSRVAELRKAKPAGPNLVVILFDDLGFGDLGSYGSRSLQTPNIDDIAAAGMRFTNGYSASPYCSASRAGLLTGRHPTRMGFDHVLQPAWTWKDLLLRIGGRNRQLPGEEITLSEILDAAGFATAIIGKWHLGDASPSLPTDRGFDHFFGLLYSNDQGRPVVWRNREIVEHHPIDQSSLTYRYTREAVAFLEAHRHEQFFLYLPHTFPHVPLHASAEFEGRSNGGLYGDVVEELDASVGQIVATLERLDLSRRTLVVITSDNGPWFQGSAGGMRGRKMDIFEGGMRVPLIAYWPGTVSPGQISDQLASALDVLPTFLELAELPLPQDRSIDGFSLAPLLQSGKSRPERTIFYSQIRKFQAIRQGRFKYHSRHGVPYGNPMDWRWGPVIPKGPWLFDLERDPDESYDISSQHPDVAQRLEELLESRKRSMTSNPRGWTERE